MCRKGFLILFSWICLANYAFGQSSGEHNIHVADSILEVRGEVYFSFSIKYLNSVSIESLSVHTIDDSLVYVYANRKGFTKFLDAKANFNLLPANFSGTKLKSAALESLDSVYPSYDRYLSLMHDFEDKYSGYCKLSEAGTSVKGRKLLMLKIASPVNHNNARPATLLTSSMHGNELTGSKLLLWLADYMLKNYGKDELVTRLMDETDIWINPLANPDGTYFGGDNTIMEATRFNANKLDLNRNFPDPKEGNHPDDEAWQPETVAMMKFYKEKGIKLSANFHTGTEVVNYPWDTWEQLHADNDWYKLISRQYADSAHNASGNKYMNSSASGFEAGIVNGYRWYRVTGGRQDYVNYYLGGREVTIELSKGDTPDSATLTKYWNYNRRSLLRYMEQCMFGIAGTVTDADNGSPINAKIDIQDYDKDNSGIYSDPVSGTFYRFLASGEYNMLFTAPGYKPLVKTSVAVSNGISTKIEVKMIRGNANYAFPNPFSREINFFADTSMLGKELTITFYNVAGKTIYKTVQDETSASLVHIEVPDHPQGIYLMEVKTENRKKVYKVVKQ